MNFRGKRIRRYTVIVFFVTLTIGIFVTYFSNRFIVNATAGKIFADINTIPYNKTGLLLGTGKFMQNGLINPFYQYRIDAAVELLKAKKIKYLVISGDNSRTDYNEPELMRADIIANGIDSSCIYLDYAGFRTFDSIIRLKEIFGQDSVTIISQQFHNERAVYIASKEKIFAIGYNAKDVGGKPGFRMQLREKLARVNLFVDEIFNRQPRFLGPKISLPD